MKTEINTYFIVFLIVVMVSQTAIAQVLVDSIYSITKIEDKYPSWSPNGKKIVFHSNRETEVPQIYVMNDNGLAIKRLTNSNRPNEGGIWSPDGSKIMYSDYVKGDNNEIFIMNSDGTGIKQLTNHPLRDGHSKFSPDGRKIIF